MRRAQSFDCRPGFGAATSISATTSSMPPSRPGTQRASCASSRPQNRATRSSVWSIEALLESMVPLCHDCEVVQRFPKAEEPTGGFPGVVTVHDHPRRYFWRLDGWRCRVASLSCVRCCFRIGRCLRAVWRHHIGHCCLASGRHRGSGVRPDGADDVDRCRRCRSEHAANGTGKSLQRLRRLPSCWRLAGAVRDRKARTIYSVPALSGDLRPDDWDRPHHHCSANLPCGRLELAVLEILSQS